MTKEGTPKNYLEKRHRVVNEWLNCIYLIDIDKESKSNMEEIKEYLKENPKKSCVVFDNHTFLSDPGVAGRVACLIDPGDSRQWIAPISHSHTETKGLKRITNIPMLKMKKIIEDCGLKTFRVIQSYQLEEKNKKKYGYTTRQSGSLALDMFNYLDKLQESGKPTLWIVTPEGQRSKKKNRALQKFENGIILLGKKIAKKNDPPVMVAVAIYFDGKYGRGLNLTKKIVKKKLHVRVGKMMILDFKKGEEKKDINILRKAVADLLPLKMRGDSSNNIGMPEVRENKAEIE